MKKHVVIREQQVLGAYDRETLLALLNGGTLKLSDSYWDAERSEWRTVVDFLGEEKARRFRWRLVCLLAAGAAIIASLAWAVLRWKTDASGDAPPAAPPPPSLPAPQPASAPPAKPAEPPPPSAVILHVEDLDHEVAVTIQNNSTASLGKVKLLLEYFWLPGAQLRLNQIAAQSLAEETTGDHARKQAAAVRGERIIPLRHLLDLLSKDAAGWTPGHHQSLPRMDGWALFGGEGLIQAGRSLTTASELFVTHIESPDSAVRRQALSADLPLLIKLAGEARLLVEKRLAQLEKEESRHLLAATEAGRRLHDIELERTRLRPALEAALSDARKAPAQKETVEADAGIGPGLVKRILVPREKHSRLGIHARIADSE